MRVILILCLLCTGCGVVDKVSDWFSDQNDCKTANGGCGAHATCHPQGQPVCTCDDGFTSDGKSCLMTRPQPVLTLASGRDFTCSLWPEGTLRCWGDTAVDTANGLVREIHPTAEVVGEEREWISFSAFEHKLCGVRKTGVLSCWQGLNGTPMSMPQADPKEADGVAFVSVAAGAPNTCGLKANGDLWCWDMFSSGPPKQLVSSTPWKNVSAGANIACAIKTDDTLWCWSPQLSSWPGASIDAAVPVELDPSRRWSELSVGSAATCAIDSEGNLFCLAPSAGSNQFAVVQQDDSTHWMAVAAGYAHRCAIDSAGHITCWGTNYHGEAGDGEASGLAHPVTSDITFAAVTVGETHSCAASTTDEVWCWGAGGRGQLGNGKGGPESSPRQVALKSSAVQIAAADDASCAIDVGGALWCWGRNWYGRVGDGTTTTRPEPVHIGTEQWLNVSAGFAGIQKNGSLWAWPLRDLFPLELDHDHTWVATSNILSPTALDSDGVLWLWDYDRPSQTWDGHWRQFAQSAAHTCAIKNDDSLWCRGYNDSGQLGNGSTEAFFDTWSPIPGSGWSSIVAGDGRTCGIQLDGTLLCWGLGLLDLSQTILTPTPVSGAESSRWKAVTIGTDNICALREDSSIWCWGRNDVYQLASADLPAGSAVPVQIGHEFSWSAISAGDYHTCALRNDGSVWCWGVNEDNQLGDGSNSPSVPVKVVTR